MAAWAPWLIGLAVLAALAPLMAGMGRGLGRKAKGGLLLASVLMGFGEVLDPRAKRTIESSEREAASPETGEPPLD